jgi:aryl-alcohol dehydrogenase-like predicted oxidoreductase
MSQVGRFPVARVGYGAMQLTGPGVFGPPDDRDEATAVLRTAVAEGVNHIDTAEYYGPTVVNALIREALYPYPEDLVIISKVGARRDETGGALRYDEPDELRRGIEDNLRTLQVDQLAAVNLRLMDFVVPDARFEAQLAAMIRARDEGLIGGIGLSNVSLAHLLRALAVTEIGTCRWAGPGNAEAPSSTTRRSGGSRSGTVRRPHRSRCPGWPGCPTTCS